MLIYWSTKERLTLKLILALLLGVFFRIHRILKGRDEVTIDVIVFISLRHCLVALVT